MLNRIYLSQPALALFGGWLLCSASPRDTVEKKPQSAHEMKTKAIKTSFIAPEFVVFADGSRFDGCKVVIGNNPRLFYLITKNGGFDRLVDVPPFPTVRTSFQGTPFDKEQREDPAKRIKRVFAMRHIAPETIDPTLPKEPGREPLNIAPAFVLTLPLLGPSLFADSIAKKWKGKEARRMMAIDPEDMIASLQMRLGKPFKVVVLNDQRMDLHFGPPNPLTQSPELASKKILVRIIRGRVSSAFSDDFYIDP